jgi:hypothetical protein
MLVIRNEQMEAFRQASQAAFERRAVEHCVAAGMEAESSVSFVREGVRSALSFGLTTEDSILRFLDLLPKLRNGSGSFHEWAAAILCDEEITPALRIALLEETVNA